MQLLNGARSADGSEAAAPDDFDVRFRPLLVDGFRLARAVLRDTSSPCCGGGSSQDLVFQPLVGRATHGPVRLTLDVTLLVVTSPASPGHLSTQSRFEGSWILGLTVTQHSALRPAIPAPVTVDGITYQVTSMVVSG